MIITEITHYEKIAKTTEKSWIDTTKDHSNLIQILCCVCNQQIFRYNADSRHLYFILKYITYILGLSLLSSQDMFLLVLSGLISSLYTCTPYNLISAIAWMILESFVLCNFPGLDTKLFILPLINLYKGKVTVELKGLISFIWGTRTKSNHL